MIEKKKKRKEKKIVDRLLLLVFFYGVTEIRLSAGTFIQGVVVDDSLVLVCFCCWRFSPKTVKYNKWDTGLIPLLRKYRNKIHYIKQYIILNAKMTCRKANKF